MVKTIVIGLDGATWKVINRLINNGELKNIKEIMDNGVYGNLKSCIPPLSSPAWPCILTGKNPDSIGIYDFVKINLPNERKYTIDLVTSLDYDNSIFELLNKKDLITYSINIPITFPPKRLKGGVVPGMLTPNSAEIRSVPKSLIDEFEAKYKTTYRHAINFEFDSSLKDKQIKQIYQKLKNFEKQRLLLTKDIIRNKKFDLLFVVFRELDYLQHKFWHYFEENKNFEYDDFKHNIIFGYYSLLDSYIGEIMDCLKKEKYNTVIISDHGFGELKGNFLLNQWLYDHGYIYLKKGLKTRIKLFINKTQIIPFSKELFKKIGLLSYLKIKLSKEFKNQIHNSLIDLKDFDMTKTKGFSFGELGGIKINKKFGSKEYFKIREELLKSLKDSIIEKESKIGIIGVREITYKKDNSGSAQDIILSLDNYHYRVSNRIGGKHDNYIIKDVYSDTGHHKPEGIFIAKGPDIKKGAEIRNAEIIDIVPTVLHLMGLQVSDDMDGKVLEEIYKEDSEPAKQPVKYQKAGERERIKDKIMELKVKDEI